MAGERAGQQIQAQKVEEDSLTSMRPAVRTDVSQSHNIDLLQSLHKAGEP